MTIKVLILNTFDIQGGAAIATYRIHRALRLIGVDSRLMVQHKISTDFSILGPNTKWQKISAILRPYLDGIAAKFYGRKKRELFSASWLPERLATKTAALKPNLIHLFWTNGGYLRIESLKQFKHPIIWTLHDMWPFTGGCHYDSECGRFQKNCGNCPVLNSARDYDLSRCIWERKQKSWNNLPIVVVATSNWLAKMAHSSSLFRDYRIEVIPNGLDSDVYKPIDKKLARNAYNLPQEKHLILFSAFSATSDKRKGGHFLLEALEIMGQAGWGDKVELMIIGASEPESPPNLQMKVHYIGQLHDEISQVLLYSAADAVVAPSMQENLSNTVMESLACGTPVVAFDVGGMPDMIDHRVNGYLAKPFDPADLAEGLIWVLESSERHDLLSQQARSTVLERYTLQAVARQYLSLYQDVLDNRKQG